MLTLSTHLPEVTFAAGDVVVAEGGQGGAMWVLVSGALSVRKGHVEVNYITRPGAVVGEVSVLLGVPYGASVLAAMPSVMRHAADGRALLESDPAITTLIAQGLAERLNLVTTYLADLKQQYDDAPGVAMIPEVLRELTQSGGSAVRTGSAREPNPEY